MWSSAGRGLTFHPRGYFASLERLAVLAIAKLHLEVRPAICAANRGPPLSFHVVVKLPGDVLPVLVRPPFKFRVEDSAGTILMKALNDVVHELKRRGVAETSRTIERVNRLDAVEV